MLALELAVHRRPVGLGMLPIALLGVGTGEQPGFQYRVGDVVRQLPSQLPPRTGKPSAARTVDGAVPTRRAISRIGIPADVNLFTSHMAHRKPLRRHPGRSFAKPKERTLWEPEEASSPRATSSRNRGRDHLGMVGDIIPEWWATSSGIRTRCAKYPLLRFSGEQKAQSG
jgi:hypothetical protein